MMQFIGVAFLIFSVILGALFLHKYEKSRQAPQVKPQQEMGSFLVTLFFATGAGEGLAREGREIDACGEDSKCVEALMEELINGPLGELTPTLPPTTPILSVRVAGDMAIIDLGRAFAEGVPSGSNGEMMAVYSIVDTITFNLPRIKKVKFLLEGESASFLHHLDLSEPLTPDFSLEKKQEVSR